MSENTLCRLEDSLGKAVQFRRVWLIRAKCKLRGEGLRLK